MSHAEKPRGGIVKSRNVIRIHRPLQGLVAFVRAVAMQSLGALDAATPMTSPTGYCLDRSEGPLNPGEGSA
jgi:hypothetical protein